MSQPGLPRDPRVDPQRLAVMPTAGRLTTIGMLAVLVPGIAVFLVCRLAGLSTGSAGGFGLLAMLVGMGWYPTYLRKVGKRADAALAAQQVERQPPAGRP